MEKHGENGRQERHGDVAVDEAHEVADDGSRGGNGAPRVHHHADPERLLAGRTTAVQGLEQGEVPPEEAEHQQNQDGTEPAPCGPTGEEVARDGAADE